MLYILYECLLVCEFLRLDPEHKRVDGKDEDLTPCFTLWINQHLSFCHISRFNLVLDVDIGLGTTGRHSRNQNQKIKKNHHEETNYSDGVRIFEG